MDSGRGRGHFGKLEPRVILIGIQARTNSSRLPGKINMPISGKPLLEHVADACDKAAGYLNRNFGRYSCIVKTTILMPGNDPSAARYASRYQVLAFPELSENDVLGRYVKAAQESRADFIVRITADCFFTAPYLVSRAVKSAVFGGHDYVSNVLIRMFREGMDVEVISRNLLDWLDKNSTTEEREHVTARLKRRELVPTRFSFSHIKNDVDDSHLKTSIDTKEDLDRAIAEVDSLETKCRLALSNGDTLS